MPAPIKNANDLIRMTIDRITPGSPAMLAGFFANLSTQEGRGMVSESLTDEDGNLIALTDVSAADDGDVVG